MGKIMKIGMVVIVLAGRYAGRKAVIIKTYDESSTERAYPHALVAGIDRYPLKITRRMGKKKLQRRKRIRPFVKIYNYTHLLPTRYKVPELVWNKQKVSKEALRNKIKKTKARAEVKRVFQDRYKTGKNRWLYTKLRF